MRKPTLILQTVLVAAASVAPTDAFADNIAWGNKTGQFVWASVGNWLSADNTSVSMNRLPTDSDDVFLWAGTLSSSPLVVAGGEVALTRNLSVSYVKNGSTGNTRDIRLEIADGGVMTNAGPVVLGNIANGVTTGRAVSGSVTVHSGGAWTALSDVTVGKGLTPSANNAHTSRIVVEQGGKMEQTAGEFIVAGYAGYDGIVTNAGALATYDLFVGGSGNGTLVNDGALTVANKFRVARQVGSSGTFVHRGGTILHAAASSQPIRVGHLGTGRFEVAAPLAFSSEMMVVGNETGSRGTLDVGDALSGIKILKLGENAGSEGTLLLNGGSVTVNATTAATASDSGHAIWVGMVNESGDQAQTATGRIQGHGKIGRTEVDSDARHARIKNYGRIVADGGDLDLGLFRLVGLPTVDANKCGTNGWFAVNGGRLIYPRRLPVSSVNHVAVGDYGTFSGTDGNPDTSLVNSLQIGLYQNGEQRFSNNRTFAMLYASDRTDIPGTVPCDAAVGDKVLGVWRLGHFSDIGDVGAAPETPWSAFDSVSVRIRFDDSEVDFSKDTVALYRYDGSTWRRVGKATSGIHVETNELQPRYDSESDNWNIGWFAVVRKRINPFVLVVR